MSFPTRFRLSVVALAALALVLGACSHYRLGPPGELPFRTLYVKPVKNNSFAPQAGALLTTQTISDLQSHANLKIVEDPTADATLEIIIMSYDREVSAPQRQDTGLAESYLLIMECKLTLTDNRSGKVLMQDRLVRAEQQAFVQGGFQIAEYQAMPVLTREVAKKIDDAVISVW